MKVTDNRLVWIGLLIIVILIILLVWFIWNRTYIVGWNVYIRPTVDPGPHAVDFPQVKPITPGAPGEYYMEGQIILFGVAEDIDVLAGELEQEGIIINELIDPFDSLQPVPAEPVEQTEPNQDSYPGPTEETDPYPADEQSASVKDQKIRAAQPQPGGDIAFRLYELDPTFGSVLQAVQRANEAANERDLVVYSEPNYLTNLPVGGSGNDGGSGISGASPNDPTGIVNGRKYFLSQWAFDETEGIHLYYDFLNSIYWRSAGPFTGSDSRVVVFDTSPFEMEGIYSVSWATEPFDLWVWHPGLRFEGSPSDSGCPANESTGESEAARTDQQQRSPTESASEGQTVHEVSKADHGLFVAGLAQGVAPGATYHLIEVLNDQACGDVFTLIRAMTHFYQQLEQDLGAPENVIFNLSLGIEAVRDNVRAVDTEANESLDALEAYLREGVGNPDRDHIINPQVAADLVDKFPIPSLQLAISLLEQRGIVVVAASGNDSSSDAQAPAAFETVLGVSSSNYGRRASCFSNPGQLAAPSGDGIAPVASATTPDQCEEHTPKFCFANTVNCEQAVISTVTKQDEFSGYAYWMGTSFSTPMVSGLAALMLDARPGSTPEQLRSALLSCNYVPAEDSVLGQGIIDVGKTMSRCLPPP